MGLFGGSSKSGSAGGSVVQDNRVVADAEAQAASGGSAVAKDYASPVNININTTGAYKTNVKPEIDITTTDYGAIKASFEFAAKAMDSTDETIEEVLGIAKSNFDQTTSALSAAYEDAKGGTLVMQRLAFAALGTVAVVMYFWLGKKGKK